MKREQIVGLCILFLLTAGAIITAQYDPAGKTDRLSDEELAYKALLASAPLAAVEGETISPDQRFLVRTAGDSGNYVSGVRVPEHVQVVDRFTDELKWEGDGMMTQSALWSPDSAFLALERSARTWCSITVIETKSWTSWEFTLPDGSPIPEYTFLPYDEPWGEWQNGHTLNLTVGRGGDDGPQHFYTCVIVTEENGQITGETRERTEETLPAVYDFNHDGVPETVQLVTWWWPEKTGETLELCTLSVIQNDQVLWEEPDITLAHVGWRSVFACSMDGQDYLVRYDPSMYQGYASYRLEIFSLDAAGKEQTVYENSLEWDSNFSLKDHEPLDIDALTDFLWEVHGYLKDSTLLISTEDCVVQSNIPGLQLQYYPLGELLPLDSRDALKDALLLWVAERS